MTRPAGACARARPHLAELALGVLEGRTRGEVLSHLEGCSACGIEADRLARTADLLAELAPSRAPRRSLDRAVLARGRGGRATRRVHRRRLALAGVLAFLVAVGAVVGWLEAPGAAKAPPAPPVRSSTGGDHGGAVILSRVLRRPDGTAVGTVTLHGGRPAWLFVRLTAADAPRVRCVLRTSTGRDVDLGTFRTASWSWAAALPVAAADVRVAELLAPGGAVLARASLTG